MRADALALDGFATARIILGMKIALRLLILSLLVSTLLVTQPQEAKGQASGKMAVVDGGAGPCSIDITVVGPDVKPVYGATVKVHVSYGFGGFRRLDLSAGTDSEGKVKFIGLPSRVHRPPLEFDATKNDLTGMLVYDPASQCEAKQSVTLHKATAAAGR
jgi:hypothetical protein